MEIHDIVTANDREAKKWSKETWMMVASSITGLIMSAFALYFSQSLEEDVSDAQLQIDVMTLMIGQLTASIHPIREEIISLENRITPIVEAVDELNIDTLTADVNNLREKVDDINSIVEKFGTLTRVHQVAVSETRWSPTTGGTSSITVPKSSALTLSIIPACQNATIALTYQLHWGFHWETYTGGQGARIAVSKSVNGGTPEYFAKRPITAHEFWSSSPSSQLRHPTITINEVDTVQDVTSVTYGFDYYAYLEGSYQGPYGMQSLIALEVCM